MSHFPLQFLCPPCCGMKHTYVSLRFICAPDKNNLHSLKLKSAKMCVLGGMVMVHWIVSFHFLFFVLLVSIVFSDLCCKDVREPEVLVILVFTGVCVYIVCSECAWASWSFSSCKVIRAKLDWAAFLSFLFLFFLLIMSKMLLDLFHTGLLE